ncbi:nuclear transport factor 2 family protein [Allorhizobium taibaishanense]|uniref:SnoaL-like domain-containing protein n=1 Tax=Allorhizobium taibaishanense TaxID=887144 RepID=A0A1Q9A0F1_9HYPH|nr:nuclear transport factor 2 family protein [Allorhizobium taibaishanense]MBB4010470.1 hypothetical protein [Allorhizobium taibaishanense]OLP47984.1 hypothetical protein BJF91_11255 [Allorhizobium taibaishanense]
MSTSMLELAAWAVMESWRELFNAHEFDQLALLYAQHASLHGTSSALLYQGREQIRSYFKGQASVEFLCSKISSLPDAGALAVGYYMFRVPEGKQIKEIEARFTFVLELGGARPQILHHHSSLAPL